MQKFLFLLLLFFTVNSFADAGYSYRFYINAEINGKKESGYLYHYSYEKFNETEDLLIYLKRTSSKRQVQIYNNIKTLELGINYDFVIKDSQKYINLFQIDDLKASEVLNFSISYRLMELSEQEFDLLTKRKVEFIYINQEGEENKISENCSDLLLASKEKTEMQLEKSKVRLLLSNEIKRLVNLDGKNSELYYKYYDKLHKELLERGYLLISVCTAL